MHQATFPLNLLKRKLKDRINEGKQLRDLVPRNTHSFHSQNKRKIDPVQIITAQNQNRIPHLFPIRISRMLASPFAFLRGSAAVMAGDLNQTPSTGIYVQACGDMHVANFGVFASAERKLIFGINDFDETHPAPWEWDLKRLTASAYVSVKYLGGHKYAAEEAARSAVNSYRKWIWQFSEMGTLETWYYSIDSSKVIATLSKEAKIKAKSVFEKATTRTHLQVLEKLTDLIDMQLKIRDDYPLIYHVERTPSGIPIKEALEQFLSSYLDSLTEDKSHLLSQYCVTDIAQKVVGVGSVGTSCWVVFLKGKSEKDPLFLQIKEALPSVLEPYTQKTVYDNEGKRVITGQKIIQGAPDIFLGYGKLGKDFYVRQLRDMKGGLEIDQGKINLKHYHEYTALCGWALALAHAKSGDAAMLRGYMGKCEEFDEAITSYAKKYSEQTEKDFEQFKKTFRNISDMDVNRSILKSLV